jgi:hypothetical protein
VAGEQNVGGLTGGNWGTVSDSYSSGGVIGRAFVGGLVGWNHLGTVTDSYSTGSVTGEDLVGGLIGGNWDAAMVRDSYSSGSVNGQSRVGGLVGINHGIVSNSFWDAETSGMEESDGGTGKSTTEMKDIDIFSGAGWSIVAVPDPSMHNTAYIWNIVDGVTYPFLSPREALLKCIGTATSTGTTCFSTSHGTIEDLEALPAIPPGAPAGIVFPHGMFSFKITGLELGQEVTVTIELPEPVPAHIRWWKEHMGGWYSIPVDIIGPNVIAITLTDGVFPGDSDKTEDGAMTDPGGPGYPGAVGWDTYPINKTRVMLPWIALLAAIIAGMSILVLRRRHS